MNVSSLGINETAVAGLPVVIHSAAGLYSLTSIPGSNELSEPGSISMIARLVDVETLCREAYNVKRATCTSGLDSQVPLCRTSVTCLRLSAMTQMLGVRITGAIIPQLHY